MSECKSAIEDFRILTSENATGFGRLIHRLSAWSLLWERMLFYNCSSKTVNQLWPTGCSKDSYVTQKMYKLWHSLKWSPGFNHNSSTGSNSLCSVFSNILKSLSVVCSVWPTQSNLYDYSANQSEEETLFIIGQIPSTTFRCCKQCWIEAL